MPSCQTGNIDWDFMCTMELYVEPFVGTIAMTIGTSHHRSYQYRISYIGLVFGLLDSNLGIPPVGIEPRAWRDAPNGLSGRNSHRLHWHFPSVGGPGGTRNLDIRFSRPLFYPLITGPSKVVRAGDLSGSPARRFSKTVKLYQTKERCASREYFVVLDLFMQTVMSDTQYSSCRLVC